ncbi:head decoration protein [Pantoea stewartii]|uniref:head decoration protein n=1 Tax=Pantoea stewartii TaxID=66269 RepID=UPI00073688C4|nr:head decoration protein [Pantoea stewartii]KTS27623.1 hypothetical protein NS381_09525 [Pantoea stewartii]
MDQFGQNQFAPGMTSSLFVPDQLVSGPLQLVTDSVTIAKLGPLLRGTVLGRQSQKSAATTAGSANKGNGTLTGLTLSSQAVAGAYTVTATDPNTFQVPDPTGTVLGNAAVGSVYRSTQVSFTLTAGANAFVAGDTFTITVAVGTGKWVPCVRTATDGSQVPSAILVDNVDSTLTDVTGGVYLMGEFNQNRLVVDKTWYVNSVLLLDDLKAALVPQGIFLRDSIQAPVS